MSDAEILKILTDAGLTDSQAQTFIDSERRYYRNDPDALRAATADWCAVAAACRAVGARQLTAAMLDAGVTPRAAEALLSSRLPTKGKDRTRLDAAAIAAAELNLRALARTRRVLA